MSIIRKLSFKTKVRLESVENTPVPVSVCKQNGHSELPTAEQGTEAILSETVETITTTEQSTTAMSQAIKDTNGTLNKSSEHNNVSNHDTPIKSPKSHVSDEENNESFAIPDGLVMDPLSPTALAVSTEFMDRLGSGLTLLRDHGKKVQKYVWKNKKIDILKKSFKSIVNVVLVEAKDLPDGPATGSNGLYCKFKLGAETHKSKQVPKTKASWCERFNIYLYDDSTLEITVWHKGKQKNFMGRCLIDLTQLEKEKTHDLWQELECGYGSLHLLITMSGTARLVNVDNVPTTNGVHHMAPEEDKYIWFRLNNNWSEVGQLSVTVHGARGLSALGLSGKADAYCVLELDNSRVQTQTVRSTTEPNWGKSYKFGINDITSTLDITIYDESIITSMKNETIGKISIPLLRITNDEKKWYALKDRSKKSSAKGNCPRILLEMSVAYNPIKASLRVLTPKAVKYTQKPPKFDIPLIYSNLKFIRDLFNLLYIGNEHYKHLFEWENRERSLFALTAWLVFWYFFRFWMTPLLLLVPFVYYWISRRNHNNTVVSVYQSDDEMTDEELDNKDNKTIKTRLYGLQELTFTIKNSIDYMVSSIERLINLANFTVPYLSYLAAIVLVTASIALYLIPVNYLFMTLGLYKFTRKTLNPDRVPNNDLLDFLSRVPDNEIVKEWRELKVPEPSFSRSGSLKRK